MLDDLPLEARAQAAKDRNFLARLRAAGRVLRRQGDPMEARHPEFVADIERRARAQGLAPAPAGRGMDTVRPNAKKQKAKRRRR